MNRDNMDYRLIKKCETKDGKNICIDYVEYDGEEIPLEKLIKDNIKLYKLIESQENLIVTLMNRIGKLHKEYSPVGITNFRNEINKLNWRLKNCEDSLMYYHLQMTEDGKVVPYDD